jgi:hypothetical protein
MLKRWWAPWVQDWRSVPKSFLLPNLFLGAAWGLAGSFLGAFETFLMSGHVLDYRSNLLLLVSQILLYGLLIAILVAPAIAIGNTLAFIQWWGSNQKLKNWVHPVDHWWTSVLFGIYTATILFFVFTPYMALGILPANWMPTTFVDFLFFYGASFLMTPVLFAGIGIMILATVLPMSLYFSPLQRKLWLRLEKIHSSQSKSTRIP